MLVGFVQGQVGQVRKNWEPETFLHTEEQLLITRLRLITLVLLWFVACLAADSILWGIVPHVLQVTLVQVRALLRQEEVNHAVVALEVLSTCQEKVLGLLALQGEVRVHRVLVQAVDKLDEVVLEKVELFIDGHLESLERLLHEHLFTVLSCKSEDIDDHTPTRLDMRCLRATDISDTHDYVLLDLRSSGQVMQHDLLKWLQEIFLEVKTGEFFLKEELVSKLPE